MVRLIDGVAVVRSKNGGGSRAAVIKAASPMRPTSLPRIAGRVLFPASSSRLVFEPSLQTPNLGRPQGRPSFFARPTRIRNAFEKISQRQDIVPKRSFRLSTGILGIFAPPCDNRHSPRPRPRLSSSSSAARAAERSWNGGGFRDAITHAAPPMRPTSLPRIADRVLSPASSSRLVLRAFSPDPKLGPAPPALFFCPRRRHRGPPWKIHRCGPINVRG